MRISQSGFMSDSPRLLIVRLSSLGDILHTLPALGDLRASFPESKIDWLVSRKNRFLVDAVCGVDAVRVLESVPGLPRLIRDLRRQYFDFAIDFQGLLKSAALTCMSGARTSLGFSRDLAREFPAHWFYGKTLAKPHGQFHVIELNRMLAAMAGAAPAAAFPDFRISEEDVRLVEFLLQKEALANFVLMNPGGGWPTKRWSPQRYGELSDRIAVELGLPVAVATGPGEETYYRAIAAGCRDSLPRHFPVSFLQLVPLMRKARLVIGGDTGPFHLACALGTPVVGIFGPTSPVRNGPWRSDDEIVARRLPCSFCYGRTCPTANECMDISVDAVFQAVIRRLEKAGGRSHADI